MTNRIFFAALFFLYAFRGFAQERLVRDAHAQKFPLEGSFHSIQVSNAIECYISQGDEESIAVSAYPEGLRERVLITTDKGVLKVRMKDEKGWRGSYRNRQLKVYVSFRELDRILLTGASQMQFVGGMKAEQLSIACSGASDMKGEVEAKQISVELTGASRLDIKGKVNLLGVQASGASDFNGYELLTQDCRVDASGASNVRVNVQEGFDVLATGASTVDYKGEPRLKSVKTNGASSLNRRS